MYELSRDASNKYEVRPQLEGAVLALLVSIAATPRLESFLRQPVARGMC
jgi:hypothetical protein